MKKLIIPVLAGLIVTSASFYVGRLSVTPAPEPPPPPAPVVAPKPVVPTALPPRAAVSHGPVVLSGDGVKDAATALAVLARADFLDRLSGQVELLRQLKPEHVAGLEQAYLADKAAGHTSTFENGLLYLRMGQVGGLAYLKDRLPKREQAALRWSAGLVLEGWASVEPDKAREWFASWPRWKSRPELAVSLVRGMASADLAKVEKFMEQTDAETRTVLWPTVFGIMATFRGLEPALDWGATQIALPESKVEQAAKIEREAKRALLSRMMEVAEFLGPAHVRKVADQEATAKFMVKKDWDQVFIYLAGRDPVATINWMQSCASPREGHGNPTGIWKFNTTWIETDAAGCARWMDGNPDHSLRDFVVWTYALKLKKQDDKAAATLMRTMRDEKLRAIALDQLAKQ